MHLNLKKTQPRTYRWIRPEMHLRKLIDILESLQFLHVPKKHIRGSKISKISYRFWIFKCPKRASKLLQNSLTMPFVLAQTSPHYIWNQRRLKPSKHGILEQCRLKPSKHDILEFTPTGCCSACLLPMYPCEDYSHHRHQCNVHLVLLGQLPKSKISIQPGVSSPLKYDNYTLQCLLSDSLCVVLPIVPSSPLASPLLFPPLLLPILGFEVVVRSLSCWFSMMSIFIASRICLHRIHSRAFSLLQEYVFIAPILASTSWNHRPTSSSRNSIMVEFVFLRTINHSKIVLL